MATPPPSHTLLDSLFEPILIVNKQGKIQYYNHHFPTFCHLPPRKLKDAHFFELLDCQELDLNDFFKKSIKEKSVNISQEIQITFLNEPSEKYHVIIKIFPHPSEKDSFIVAFNDMSVEKNIFEKYRTNMQELKESHSQIVQADKLSTIGELTASISHEINNPLTIAMGNMEVLQTMLEDTSGIKENSELITQAVNDIDESLVRIKDIINNMKGFLHKSEDKKSYVYMKEMIDESLKLMQHILDDAKIEVNINTPDPMIVSLLNRTKITQVLVNLLKNAADALIENKTKSPQITITLAANTTNNSINLKIRDNGPGIEKDKQEEVFNPFFTTKEVGVGTGLGLSICKKIIDAHHGELSVESDGQSYTEFNISLPALEITTLAENDPSYMSNENSSAKKILVIDNEPQILNIMNNYCDTEGHIFVGSTNATEALNLYERMSIDLIITDYSMPVMNGTEFVTEVRKNAPHIPVLYMTSKSNFDQFKKDQQTLNVKGIIIKPFSKDDVLNMIRVTLGDDKKHGE